MSPLSWFYAAYALHEEGTESASATQKTMMTTKDNDANAPINTSFIETDVILQESDETTLNISKSSPKEKQISKDKKENKVKKNTDVNKQMSRVILGDSMFKPINRRKFLKDWNQIAKCMLSIFQVYKQIV